MHFKRFIFLIIAVCFFACNNSNEEAKINSIQKDTIKPSLTLYAAPDTSELKNDDWGKMVKYGLLLVKNTAYYIGLNGTVSKNLGNKMNCTNCHLENGTKPFGVNFFNSHKTYPQYRAREDKILSLADRVNNCIERPHNGKPLKLDCKEMIAIISYIKWVGEKYNTELHEGHGIKYVDFKGLTADSKRGENVYKTHCASCHQTNGEGKLNLENTTYTYPPLWGKTSYQEGSSMHRVIKAASFIKYNMPNTVTWQNPTLTDQEALDVAAFVNDGRIHERPKPSSKIISYPNTHTKPIDYFKGPYNDTFTEEQHTFGPWDAIIGYYEAKGLKIHK